MFVHRELLAGFLVEAKKHTYAAQGDEATVQPLLQGSKQLEYGNGDFFYRDIYFGYGFFAGQETVEFENQPVWAMVYSGGVIPGLTREQTASIYRFLDHALMQVDTRSIYRGPNCYDESPFEYDNAHEGTLEQFHGKEIIRLNGETVYELQYSGGIIR